MSDEIEEGSLIEPTEIMTTDDVVTGEDSIVAQAKEMGWRPKEEFTGSEHDWKGPGAFIKDAELFASLRKQAKEIESLQTTLQDVKVFMSKSEEVGYQKAIADVKARRKEALDTFDVEALEQADNEYIELQQELINRAPTATVETQNKSQDELEFETRHKDWYNDNTPSNASMKREAILLSSHLAATQPELTAQEHIKVLETKIRKLYPEKFKNTNRTAPSPVDTGGKSVTANTDEVDVGTISPQMLDTAKRFVKQGVFKSVSEYLTYAKKSGVI